MCATSTTELVNGLITAEFLSSWTLEKRTSAPTANAKAGIGWNEKTGLMSTDWMTAFCETNRPEKLLGETGVVASDPVKTSALSQRNARPYCSKIPSPKLISEVRGATP